MLSTPSTRLTVLVTAWMLAGTIAAVAQYSRGAQSLRKTSELYDERGYAQSKAVTVDGRLSVAPSNGGVAYTFPVAQRTIHGFPITVSLNYCGSVSFSTYASYDQGSLLAPYSRWSRFSQNRPAWTIGVNGFAMQVISFATSYHCDPSIAALTTPSVRTSYGDSDFVWTVDGYDVCNRMERLPIANADNNATYTDVIRLLREDGSVLELVNTKTQTSTAAENRADLYTGYYRVNEANARGYGLVEFDTTNWPNHIRQYAEFGIRYAHPLYPFIPRRLRYFAGDGLEYVFREWIAPHGLPAYADSRLRYGGMWAGPTIFYLDEIRNNDIVLTRALRSRHYPVTLDGPGRPHDDSTKGRALFTELENVCEVLYHKRSLAIQAGGRTVQALFDTIAHSGSSGGQDELPLARLGYMNQWSAALAQLDESETPYRSQVGYLSRIVDPAGRITRFRYEPYRRRFRGFGFPVEGASVEVALDNWRLVEVDEPTSRYEICYHDGDVRSPLVGVDCPTTASDELMTYNTQSAGNPSALSNMARQVRKYDHDGTPLLTDEYGVGDFNTEISSFSTATHRTHDHPSGTTRLLTYSYERHALPAVLPFAPAPVFTELRAIREDAAGRTTITTTYYTRPTDGWYLWMPMKTLVTVNGVRRSIRQMEYLADTVRRYGDDAALTAACGWEVTRMITKTFNPDSTLRLVDTVDYRHYPKRDTVVEWISRRWKKHATIQRFLELKYDLADTAFATAQWEQVMFDPRVAVYRDDTIRGDRTRTPHFGIERRSVTADADGTILTGRTRVLRGDLMPAIDQGSPGLTLADSAIGRGGRAMMLREAFLYGEDWSRNLAVVRIGPNGGRTLIAYDSLRDGDGGATALRRLGLRLTNDDSLLQDRLGGLDPALLEEPQAEARIIRTPRLDGSIATDTLVTERERSFFGQASALLDENGWITRSSYDRNGRLLATWLPGDFPRKGVVDTFYYDGPDSTDLYGTTSNTQRIDTLRCMITQTAPPTYPRAIGTGTVPVITYDPTLLRAALPVTRRERCPCADTGATVNPKQGGSLLGDCSDTITYAMTGEYPGYRAHLAFRVDRNSKLRTLTRADSALVRLYVANIEGECVSVRVSIAALDFTRSYLFNCPQVEGDNHASVRGESSGLQSTQASVRRERSLQGPYFDVRLDTVLWRIAQMRVDDTFGIEIRVTSPGTGIRFASSAAAADMRPKLIVFGRYRTVSDTVDYTLALRHVDDSLMSEVFAKTDDTRRTASRWTINRYHADIRRSRIRHYFGADFRQRFSQIAIGEPGVPSRLDTVSFGHTGAGERRVERDQNGGEIERRYDGLGRVVDVEHQDGSRSTIEYRVGTPASCGIAEDGQDFRGFCSAVITTDESGVRHARYFDAFDGLRREVAAVGTLDLTTRYEYDAVGRPVLVVNANLDSTRYTYDDFGRVRTKAQPDLGTVSYSYDNAGNIRFAQSADQAARGLVSYTSYDDAGRVTLVGEATVEGIPGATRATDLLDGSRMNIGMPGEEVSTVNRSLYMPAAAVQQPRVWPYEAQLMIAPAGCLLRPTSLLGERHTPDPPYLSHPTAYYDPIPQPAASLADLENVALHPHFARLAMGYDALPARAGSIWSAMPADSAWMALAPRGALRNLRGREAAVAWREHGGEPWHYGVFSYDERGRVEALLRYTENVGFDAVYYDYNALNQVTLVRVADPLNHHLTWYGYDQNGKLDSIWTLLERGGGLGVGAASHPAVPARPDDAAVVFEYTRTGHVATMSYPPALLRVDYAYTPRKWIDSIVARSTGSNAIEPLFRERITYDQTGQMAARASAVAGQPESRVEYEYDAARRLVQWTDATGIESLVLDPIGNRRSGSSVTWPRSTYTYASKQSGPNRLLTRQQWNTAGDWSRFDYTYDLDGAVTARQGSDSSFAGLRLGPPETFTYSYRELLRRYTYNGPTHDWRYRYSPSGEREQKRLYPVSMQSPESGNEYPWVYYLLGAAGEQLALWHGRDVYRTQCTYGVPVGTAWMYPVAYKSLGGGLTRVSTRPDIAVPNGVREYYVADGLGSTRLVVAEGGAVVEGIDYDPHGRPVTGLPAARQSYVGRERDLESGLSDHGVRKYEPAEGRFHSVDPRWESFRNVSPYQYAHSNPVNRVDANGQWDIVVHVAKDRSQNGYGIAVVTNRKGEEVFRFAVRVEGQGADRMKKNGDTPLGVYDIPAGSAKWISGKSRAAYGPNPRLRIDGLGGEIVASGRSEIRIHGGRQEKVVDGKYVPSESPTLEPTHGCLRAYDNTVKALKEVTDQLEASDELEEGGQLYVVDDLVEHNGEMVPASDLDSSTGPR
ncbi:MAG TPA: RHS repeat-associated core domain-containing protein [Candidatus Kapabacteria bacterium]|nr:RHS repeat-associated core domain-containing protein [Candidatus Kapabacteria bacterium]